MYANAKSVEVTSRKYALKQENRIGVRFIKYDTGCLIKNASTHNFCIYYPISTSKKNKDMVFHALRSSHKIKKKLALFSVANDSQLFFF
jgi:hypothetical protein